MPAELLAFINAGWSDRAYAHSNLVNAANWLITAADAIGGQYWADARTALLTSSGYFSTFAKYLTKDDAFYHGMLYDWKEALLWINTNWPTGGGATMDDILNAMLGATFAQLQQFIGIEDAYRVALWNAPFNVDFYAALARGFQKWP